MRKFLAIIFITIGSALLLELLVSLIMPVYLGPADYFDDFYIRDAELGYTMKPGFYGEYKQDYSLIFRANAYGFRDNNYGSKKENVLRILAIGDSFTFGSGVSLEETWVKQLEAALLTHDVKTEVINAGLLGYGTIQYSKVMKRLGSIYKPDIVIVMVTTNDPGNDLATESGIYPPLKVGQDRIRKWLKRHSNLAKRLWLLYLYVARPRHSFADADNLFKDTNERASQAYELFDEALRNIKNQTKQNGIWLILTASQQLSKDIFSQHLFALSTKESITLFDAFRRKTHVDFTPRNSAGHWSPEGHQEVGEVLAEDILNSEYLSKSGFYK